MRKLNLRKRIVTAALIVLAAFGAAVVSPAPASANIEQGFVVGVGIWWDDWDDEGPLNMSSYNHNNVVAMWQHILWADGELNWAGIDCWFGRQTWDATERWKADRVEDLGDNGEAGHGAFNSAAYWQLEQVTLDGNHYVYKGKYQNRRINFWRGSDDIWTMSISGDIHKLAYGYANFDKCT